ncbi:uncharacterized protein Z519_11434 [Cladophialophora bantiana CBS 173.52]|uniref:Uncharacterized protein n=1 Tax=Cladophialophora bantiana (strain ATCC 10958 / CBS 173.52 / CDC B-1940 / NIH 8579) TaxID=1442370 RepID=A0A0D2HAB3_CLAB1|nr:uncharacterized protein Z519_11434 [Cladophialophora bantiana CBS 173.52]KIW87850.1 hypothetical protein Z519_11434 [Cladophialophora bantiana CBS 173.52]
MGYSKFNSLLPVTPLGAYEVVILIGVTYLAMKTKQRLWFYVITHIPSFCRRNPMATTEKTPALIGYYLSGGIPKITVTCIGTIAYTVRNIISPQTFQAKDAPRYVPAKVSIVILYFLITADLYLIRIVYVRRNKKRDE